MPQGQACLDDKTSSCVFLLEAAASLPPLPNARLYDGAKRELCGALARALCHLQVARGMVGAAVPSGCCRGLSPGVQKQLFPFSAFPGRKRRRKLVLEPHWRLQGVVRCA